MSNLKPVSATVTSSVLAEFFTSGQVANRPAVSSADLRCAIAAAEVEPTSDEAASTRDNREKA